MAFMELQEGATVRTAEGENLGKIDQFVVDPSTSEVTHIVVHKGLFFTDDRVIGISQIEHIDDTGPILSSKVDPSALPPFETTNYVPVDQETRSRLDRRIGAASMWRFPTIATGMYPGYPIYGPGGEPLVVEVTRVNVPDAGVLIDEDTPVVSMEGDKVGSVAEVYVDDEGHLSHLVVDLGTLAGDRVLPAHWIEAVREDQVSLAVGKEALDRLEAAVN
jgi:sporulation protein YlmC with PRC-barrel domain